MQNTETQVAAPALDLVRPPVSEPAPVTAVEDAETELSPATPAAAYASALSAEPDRGAPGREAIVRGLASGYGNDYVQQVLENLAGRPAPVAEEPTADQQGAPSPAPEPEVETAPEPAVEEVAPAEPATAAPEVTAEAAAPEAEAPEAAAPEAEAPEAEATPESTAAAAAEPAAAATPAGAAAEPSAGAAPTAAEVAAAEAESQAPAPTGAPAAEAAREAPAEGGAELPAEARAPASPAEDPAFQAVVARTKSVAHREGHNTPAQRKAAEAQAAARGPENEVRSQAAGAQVDKMDEQEPAPFDKAAFKAALLAKIAEITPKNLEEADEFKEQNKAASLKGDVATQVASGKEGAQGAIRQTTEETPDPGAARPKEVVPQPPTEAGAAPAGVGGERAAPKPKTDAEVSLAAGSQSLDQQLADNEVTEEQLERSNEPEFQDAVARKDEAQTDAEEEPAAYRQDEAGMIAGAEAGAGAGAGAEVAAMHGAREAEFGAVAGEQETTRSADEQRRAEVAARIEQIYEETKQRVEARLERLDQEVDRIFDDGAERAKQQFETYVDRRMSRYKYERYSGPLGLIRWGGDKLFGMPDEVNAFYQEGRKLYIALMDKVIDEVANAVETGLNEATAMIAEGRRQIQEYVASLPEDLREVGEQAADDIQTRFDSLEQTVANRRDQLIDSLAQRYVDNLSAIDARIEEMQAANRGLVDAALDAIGGVIETILELKNMLLGVLARAAAVIGQIIGDPIGFFGNLIDAVGQGLDNFVSNIGTHLQQGLMGWLFGTMAEAGIELPASFDLKGILSLVLQVLGLTYANIRARAVRLLGEEMVSRLEQVAEIFMILVNEGPAGLWEYIKDKIGDLKSMVIDAIKDFVIEKIVTAGIMWLVSLLNPVAAFIKACKAIYDIIMFFVNRASQIMALINAIIDSIAAIASGAIASAAAAVENALARALPVAISFLAALLGLGGISKKIRSIIEKIQAPVNKAIDWVIKKAVAMVRAIGGLFGGERREEEEVEEDDPEKTARITAGLAALHQEERRRFDSEGQITREEAEEAAATTRSQHPVFTSLQVVDGGDAGILSMRRALVRKKIPPERKTRMRC
ncbi:MAG: hypothetical protein GY856_55765 [bacterium]|nr:hypothetical protein [bacterium]